MENSNIIIVEDDESYLELYQEILSEDFNVSAYNKAEDALSSLEHIKPQVVLLDLNLPQMCGFELCKQIRDKFDVHDVTIIVVSGDNSVDARLKTLEMGADDFMAKPFEIKELLHKVNSALRRQLNYAKLHLEAEESKELAFTSMQQASQYSYVMNFFKSLTTCQSTEEIARVFFDSMRFFGLNASLYLSLPEEQFFSQSGEEVPPIEQEVFKVLSKRSRLYEFSNRLIVNDKHASFLVKNMPDDEHYAGQIRDFAAALVEGVEAKLIDLYVKLGMEKSINELANNINELKSGINQHNKIISGVMSEMMSKIASSYHTLELTEAQELFFNEMVESGLVDISQAEAYLVEIMSSLEKLKIQMESIHASSRLDLDLHAVAPDLNNDVELF